MKTEYKSKTYQIERYPKTSDRSLKPWSAADELLLSYLDEHELSDGNIALYNDRFGYLTCLLNKFEPRTVINYASQLKACELNVQGNKLTPFKHVFPLEQFAEPISTALLKMPKSHDLFEFQLQHICKSLNSNGTVLCGFMTKHFSANLLKIAAKYFDVVEQSRAVKKARLLILKKPKQVDESELVRTIKSQSGQAFKQYYGVFSGNNIDYATEFLITHLEIEKTDETILDLASGNGVLANAALMQQPGAEVHLIDDAYLAIESSKLNIDSEKAVYHAADTLGEITDAKFDVVISNPPFHFDYETNIDVTLNLFQDAKRCLKYGGNFQMVANRHLPYKPKLELLFSSVQVVAQNNKFIVYRCQ